MFFRKKFDVRAMRGYTAKEYETVVAQLVKTAKRAEPTHLGLKLIVISDTHGDLGFGNKFEVFFEGVEEYDLCIILGDLCSYELERILKLVPKDKILALRGNHDRPDLLDQFGIPNLNGKTAVKCGVTFAGIEGSFRYKSGAWPMYTHYESLLLATGMQGGADVLLTHDRAFLEEAYDHAHAGLVGISHYIFTHAVKHHIHGHIHKSYRAEYQNGTAEYSVYGCEYLEI